MTELSTHLKQYEVSLLFESTTEEELRALDKEIPSDTYLVRYNQYDEEKIAAFRAYKAVDIFDALHDLGCQVLEIKLGFGSVKPKLFGG